MRNKLKRGLDGVFSAACRVGLIHPVFDSDTLAAMPFRRPTTVVTDTSAIVQGGLDFVVRFLYPMARVKVPAIAHMELLNACDNYLSLRRGKLAKPAPGRIVLEHALSQGGQRALLRLELQTDTEIERGRLGADPEERDPKIVYLRTKPFWDGLQSDPRFHALLRRMRLV